MTVRIVEEVTLREKVIPNDGALEVVEKALGAVALGQVTMPPIQRMDFPASSGEIDTKAAWIEGAATFTVKMSTGFFHNPSRGLPSGNGLMVVFSAETGLVQAVLLDNGYLTNVRTGLAGAVAAKHLSRPDSKVATLVGAGEQAWFQLRGLLLVRPIEEIRVVTRSEEKGAAFKRKVAGITDAPVHVSTDLKAACEGTDLLISCTPAQAPLVTPDCLHPGMHVTAMGSDAEDKNEIDPRCFERFDFIACDSLAQCYVLGELHHSQVSRDRVVEVGLVAEGKTAGRGGHEQVTFCDLTGTGAQDAAISAYALSRI